MGAISGKFHRAVRARCQELINAAGGTFRFDTAGDHAHGKIIITVNGRTRSTPLPSTPRADLEDAVRMKVCDVRRILRELAQ